MNKKYAVTESGRVKRVVVCSDPSLIVLADNEELIEAGMKKVRNGESVEKHFPQMHRRSYKDMIIGAAIAGGIGAAAAAIQYFL